MSKLRIAPRGTPPQPPDPPTAATLPDEARGQLGMLVTELGGIGRAGRSTSRGMTTTSSRRCRCGWIAFIAGDLATIECRSYPAQSTGAK
jgi:hypothetical protein